MKITREWLASTGHCADGWAWGDMMLGAEGKELDDCWALIDRPDWLLSMIVKTQVKDILWARDALAVYLETRLPTGDEGTHSLKTDAARDLWESLFGPEAANFHTVRHAAAEAAYIMEAVSGDSKAAAECMAVAFYCLTQTALIATDTDKALIELQAAFNMLGNAHGKEKVCQFLAESAKIKRKTAST